MSLAGGGRNGETLPCLVVRKRYRKLQGEALTRGGVEGGGGIRGRKAGSFILATSISADPGHGLYYLRVGHFDPCCNLEFSLGDSYANASTTLCTSNLK